MAYDMKDERLGSVILYNFTKAYGKPVAMSLYDIVLPFMFNATFVEEVRAHETLEATIYACDNRDADFRMKILAAIDDLQEVTNKSLGLALVREEMKFDIDQNGLSGRALDVPMTYLIEPTRFGEMVKHMTKDDIIELLKKKKRLKIVILQSDSLGPDVDMRVFYDLGNVTLYPTVTQDQVIDYIKDADIVLTNKNIIGKEEMDAAPHLKMVGVLATGYNNIDVAYAKSKGIKVTNAKGYSTASVAQLTMAMACELLLHLRQYDWSVKSHAYEECGTFSYFPYPFHEFSSLTWGIVGLGAIGRQVDSYARALGFKTHYYSASGAQPQEGYQQVTFDELLESSDIISIHAPLSEATEYLFDESAFAKMKSSAYLINVARGPIVSEKALVQAIDAGEIAGAGLDVFEEEPLRSDSPLYQIVDPSKLVLAPHIGWASIEARQRLVSEVYANIEAFLKGEDRNVVNGD